MVLKYQKNTAQVNMAQDRLAELGFLVFDLLRAKPNPISPAPMSARIGGSGTEDGSLKVMSEYK